MKKINHPWRTLIMAALWLSLCVTWPIRSNATYQDGIIAIVNNEIVTRKDLREYLGVIYMGLVSAGQSQEEIQQTMAFYETHGLERLIDDQLMLDAAKQRDILIRPEAIARRIEEIQSYYPSRDAFISELIAQGLTLTDLRQKIENQFKTQYLEEMEVRSRVFVSPQDVSDFYKSNPDRFLTPERVDLGSVFIPYGDDPQAARKKAEQALSALQNQKNIAQDEQSLDTVAEEFSESLPLGIIAKGEALPEIEEIIFNLLPGEISPLVEMDDGFFIFYVKEKFPAQALTLEDAKEQIYNFLFQQRFQERREQWLQNLRKDTYIDIRS